MTAERTIRIQARLQHGLAFTGRCYYEEREKKMGRKNIPAASADRAVRGAFSGVAGNRNVSLGGG